MRTLAHGRVEIRRYQLTGPKMRRHHRNDRAASPERGFTLLEMMVVLLIIGIATSLAGVSAVGNHDARALRQDAHRLAQLFTAAQIEARASGHAIVWQHGAKGYRFSRQARKLILPAHLAARSPQTPDVALGAESVLRPREWSSNGTVSVRIEPGEQLVFGSEWIPDPLRLELSSNGQTVTVLRKGNGRFVVES
ncbi:MAG TPA: type II secretion system minor pseudopilin GspH [Pusillimonas sp.]|uniref:type II secretion system minor pseudopilin GspH n=1 Tax=Pusillimonas sp. TaxID=3040095 RepID=UPI002BAA2507|nr:type II secretion system minor pseudopilin GspH [Pusillimonas sp.]HUH87851.1 type II secretion system minor pseudopilin GspH [Pusillimonas sp.]